MLNCCMLAKTKQVLVCMTCINLKTLHVCAHAHKHTHNADFHSANTHTCTYIALGIYYNVKRIINYYDQDYGIIYTIIPD